jgi:nitrogen fixation protein NifU and related proteins
MARSADSPSPVPGAASLPPDIGVASLYQEIILSHYRAPKHKGTILGANKAVEHRNPLCGDVLSVQIAFEGARIANAAFAARACSITQATASMLLSRIIGGTVADAHEVVAQIERLLENPGPLAESASAQLGDLRALASVARFPARKACVRLVTAAVSEALAAA